MTYMQHVNQAKHALAATAHRIDQLFQDIATLDHEIMALELEGTSNASAHWRDGKYLYLIYPMENGQRRREYIGNKPDNVQGALERVKRHKRCQQLRRERARVRSNLREYIRRSLDLMSTEARTRRQPDPTQ
jgi:hypothetical protein